MPITDEMVEAAARALYLRRDGNNPDWPIGVDENGYRQEPHVRTVPAWKWFYEHMARIALEAGLAASTNEQCEDLK